MPEAAPASGELRPVIDRVRALFHLLKAAAERVHNEGERSAARRGVLLDLHAKGPRTVPRIAADRPVSRQHIQAVVNTLLDDGLVERIENPDHRRSHLIQVTETGRARVREIVAREAAVFSELDIALSADQLHQAEEVLAELCRAFQPGSIEEVIHRLGPLS